MGLPLDFQKDALFLDIDGTLLDIAPTAREVVLPPALREDLARLSEKLDGALALVSGRVLEEVDALFDPLRLPCAGAHGAQWRLRAQDETENAPPLPALLRDDIALAFHDDKDLFVEDKITSVAVHYRQAPEKGEAVRRALERLVPAQSDEIRLLSGRMVWEVVQNACNKESAIKRFLAAAPFEGRSPLFLGDDVTDLPAIAFCKKNGGRAVRVGGGDLMDRLFPHPADVRAWLAQQAA